MARSSSVLRTYLQDYFRRGWVCLLPYLAAYLLFAWQKWPVNAVPAGRSDPAAEPATFRLLHALWLLHGVLGGIACWKSFVVEPPGLHRFASLAPWLGLPSTCSAWVRKLPPYRATAAARSGAAVRRRPELAATARKLGYREVPFAPLMTLQTNVP